MSANFRYKLRVLSGARFSKLNDVATEIIEDVEKVNLVL